MRSAVIIAVPEAAGAVDHWREQSCNDKPSLGVPAHVTVLFPFVPAAELDDGVISTLAEAVATVPAFSFELRETARFDGVLYLAPEPANSFLRLTEAVVARFPAYPPYEGAHDTVIPHLTVAQGEPSFLDEAEREVVTRLPLAARADEALLLTERDSRWSVRAELPLSRATRTRR
jgi:hypothetical protein